MVIRPSSKGFAMQLAFHGATTMPCDLETDVAVTAAAGFGALEVWAAKMDRYLADHSLADLNTLFVSERHRTADDQLHRVHRLPNTGRVCRHPNTLPGAEPHRPGHRLLDRRRGAQSDARPGTCRGRMSWRDTCVCCATLGEIAGEFDVRLSFEFLGFGWCSVRTPRAAAEIVARDRPRERRHDGGRGALLRGRRAAG